MSLMTGAIIIGALAIAGTIALALWLGRETPEQRAERERWRNQPWGKERPWRK